MPSLPRFNYIITIHNKESLMRDVLSNLLSACGENSHIYPVLDGCTDRTEAIIDQWHKETPQVSLTKVYTPDVHEILSINAGLKAADQSGAGYNIILQDDVLLQDPLFEQKITQLYQQEGPQLGFVSFRHGANLQAQAKMWGVYPFKDYIENAYGHGQPDATVLLPGQLAYRAIVIKSPVCIPCDVIRKIGMLDERLAPFMCDDIEYSLRCLKAGYRNAVFSIKYQSDVEWGTTRTNPDSRHAQLEKRNMNFILAWHGAYINQASQAPQATTLIEIAHAHTAKDRDEAKEILRLNREKLSAYNNKNNAPASFTHKVKNKIKRLLGL